VYAEPLTLLLAERLLSVEARSALPDAPVVDDRTRFGIASERARLRLATSLRSAAERVDPYVAPVSRTA
jgi:hypothetical protein